MRLVTADEDRRGMQRYVELLREIGRLENQVIAMQEPMELVREALDRFCPPEMRGTADRWLEHRTRGGV